MKFQKENNLNKYSYYTITHACTFLIDTKPFYILLSNCDVSETRRLCFITYNNSNALCSIYAWQNTSTRLLNSTQPSLSISILQAYITVLLARSTLSLTTSATNTVAYGKESSSQNVSDQKALIINGIKGIITNRDWRNQVNQVQWTRNGWLSNTPTNVIKCKLFCKTGYHLQIRRNGVVSGTMNQHSRYSKCISDLNYHSLYSILIFD